MDLSDLYRGPLEEFVARRARLVREARPTDPSTAQDIGKIRKPSVSVWAIDQLVIAHEELLLELLAAGADARALQQAVAGQVETREALLVATGRLRDALEGVARAADDVLENGGHARSEDTSRRIRATLQSAATGTAADRLALWRGTLDREVVSTGFGALSSPDDDAAELAAVLAPLRRAASPTGRQPAIARARLDDEHVRREAAERAVAKQDAAATRARDLATAKRAHAQRLADEARVAEAEATAAEDSARAAEDEARAAHSALSS
jgi:hypothetical protein